jgi:hypothetical protein
MAEKEISSIYVCDYYLKVAVPKPEMTLLAWATVRLPLHYG